MTETKRQPAVRSARFWLSTAATAVTLLSVALPASAVDLGLSYASATGLPNVDIRVFVAGLLRTFMGLLGLLLVVKIMQGGFIYMTHGGSEERRAEAIGTIKGAVIGMALVMTSASIANFVVNAIMNAATNASQGSLF
jgi:hypothetical protein